MPSLIEILIGVAICSLFVAIIISIADGIWDRIEDDVAKQEGYDKIEK